MMHTATVLDGTIEILGTLWKRLRASGPWLGGLKLEDTTFDCSLPSLVSLSTRAHAHKHSAHGALQQNPS